ncbi:MAG: M67 family metallopeptidase [Betaproteobacteria bacterium]|nr:M67 family metallopeptidase [Betaproteobacteria bacterium]
MPVLRLPETLCESVSAFAREGYPQETCGLLLGKRNGAENVVARVRQARNINLDRSQDRYEIHPEDFLAADREAREAGMDIVGVWHSHPDHPARPSETDRAAAWPEWSYVIVAVGPSGVQEVRCWRLASDDFEEEVIAT